MEFFRQTVTIMVKDLRAEMRSKEALNRETDNGHVWDALTLNGLAISSILGEDPRPALSAIEAGALGAGLSGKGPSIAAIVEEDSLERVRQTLEKFPGRIIEAKPNFSKAVIEQ